MSRRAGAGPEPSWTDPPRRVEPRVYQELRTGLVEALDGRPWVRGLVEFGSVGHPGISDLDVLVVASPEAGGLAGDLAAGLRKVRRDVGGPNAHLLDLTPVSPEVFAELHRYAYLSSPGRTLLGHEVPESALSDRERLVRDVGALLGVQTIRWHFLARQLLERRVRQRGTLLTLHSVRYGVEIVRNAGAGSHPGHRELVEEVLALRDRWFELGEEERRASLLALAVKGLGVTRELLLAAGRLVEEAGMFPPRGPGTRLAEPRLGTFLGFGEENPGSVPSPGTELRGWPRWTGPRRLLALGPVLGLPDSLGRFLAFMTAGPGAGVSEPDWRPALEGHRRLIREHRAFLVANGVVEGTFSVGNLLWRPRGWKARLLSSAPLRELRFRLARRAP